MSKLTDTLKAKAQEIFADILAPMIEVEAKKAIEKESDKLVDKVFAKVTELIPGKLDDSIAEGIKPKVKEDVKAYLLGEADKISDKV